MQLSRIYIGVSACSMALCLFGAETAAAQTDRGSDVRLDDIVVTATKRSANVQNIPIAVSAFSSETLNRAGIQDARQLMAIAPSLNLTATTSDARGVVIRVRGLGSEALNPGLESSVGTVIDGVYRARSNLSLEALPGIDRVELLRGPQGTLFGKNTTSGVVNVTTKAPSFTFTGDALLSIGNYDSKQFVAGISGPLVEDRLAARVDIAVTRRDGFITDLVTGKDYRNKNKVTVRGQLLWTPTPDFSGRFIVDASHYRQTGPDTYVIAQYGTSKAVIEALGGHTVPVLDYHTATLNTERNPFERNNQVGGSAEFNWEHDWGKITSITAYRSWRNHQEREVDYSDLDLVNNNPADQRFKNFSQELRVAGTSGRLDWLVGGFFTDERVFVREGYKFGKDAEAFLDALLSGGSVTAHPISALTGLPFGQSLPDGTGIRDATFRQTARSFSLFTHDTVNLTDRLSITGGLRWTHEKKSLNSVLADAYNPGCNALLAKGISSGSVFSFACLLGFDPRFTGSYSGSKSESEFSGVASLMFELGDHANTYVSYSRGYKGGGFVLDVFGYSLVPGVKPPSAEDLKFDPEFADNYEFGLKTRLFDQKLQANIALFYTKLTDYQLTYNTGAAIFTRNVPEVISKGVEIETEFRPTATLRGSLGATYADTHYGTIPAISGLPATIVSHAQLYNAPKWTVTGSLGWDSKSEGRNNHIYAYLDGRYISKVMVERSLAVGSDQKGYLTVNGKLGFGKSDDRWAVELWARNLLNEHYFVSEINATFQSRTLVGVPGDPRMWGASLIARW